MSAGNDRSRPADNGTAASIENPGESSTAKGTRRTRVETVWHAVAHGYVVVGTRGRSRLVLVVAACPFCRCPHAHNGKPDFINGRRKAACGRGRYVVHVSTVEGRWAA